MTRLLTVAIVAACVLSLSASPQQPIFRGTSDAVRVFVTVTDHDGRLITSLEQKDFEVRDEGKPQPITLFDNTPQPVRLIEMLDSLPRDLTLLLIEHDMDVALTVAARVVVMADGVVVASGTPDEIRHDPLVHEIYLGRGGAS